MNTLDYIFDALEHVDPQDIDPALLQNAKKKTKKAAKALKKVEAAIEAAQITEQDWDQTETVTVCLGKEKDLKKAEKDEKPIYRTYEDFPFEQLQQYAGLDCIATSELLARTFPAIIEEPEIILPDAQGQMVRGRAPAIIDSIQRIEMPAHEFILDLEINGIQYDIDENRRIQKRMNEEVSELEERIYSQVPSHWNLDSGTDVAYFLYEERGFTPPFMTKGGEPATDGEALLMLSGLDPMGGKYVTPDPALQYLADMAKRRDIVSVRRTFIDTYIEDFVKRTGRIHPNYNLFGTSSFRITGDNPNLTQLPRAKHGYNVRSCYVVRDGYVFIAFDFSSAEVKILGALCKDPTLLKAIADGLDFHSFSASQMLGIPYDEFMAVLADKANPLAKQYKVARQNAKALTFGILYGSSVNGIALALNLSKDEAERLIALYFKTYPKIEEYVQNSHKMALWNQFVITPFGQRKQEYGTHKVFKPTASYNAALRNSQNVRVQSTTSTLGLVVFSNLNEAIKKLGGMSICTVYDSIEMEVPIVRAAEAIETAFYYMDEWPVETFDFLDLPIGVEGEIGRSWGSLETVHRGVTQAEIEALLATMH